MNLRTVFKQRILRVRYAAARVAIAGLMLWPAAFIGQKPPQDITCEDGSGEYSVQFRTGTTVTVGPVRTAGFAERGCAAGLTWGSDVLKVASDAGQVGIDVLGVDLGMGVPVVAFQIDATGSGTDRRYAIYSLSKPPRLLYTITGGSFYAASDTDLDGRVEIWTDDAAAVNGFEGVPLQSLDFTPTVVLRFEDKQLVDAGSEFKSYYDGQIATLRSQLDPQGVAAFKNSDGVLSLKIARSDEERHRLAQTKIKVMEIVCAYLYSGRQVEAWSVLDDMWPSPDLDRIRNALMDLHQRGILRDVMQAPKTVRRRREVHVYDATADPQPATSTVLNPGGGAPNVFNSTMSTPPPQQFDPDLVRPQAILLRRPPPAEVEDFRATGAVMELVVDAAGKVRSASLIDGNGKRWIRASAGWHFIPALRNGRPVACRFRLSVRDMK